MLYLCPLISEEPSQTGNNVHQIFHTELERWVEVKQDELLHTLISFHEI